MSGFSPAWLALREPADHRARDASLQAAALAALPAAPRLLDLGCGSGSNLRALAPHLPDGQRWRLVDHDSALLAAARDRLSIWADRVATVADGALHLEHAGKRIEVRFEQADLARDVAAVLAGPADLVTAAAFFDLVAPVWIDRFCAALVARALPLLAVLTYDGAEHWLPRHPLDGAVLDAFHGHQANDKGFGPAAGPQASGLLEAAFRSAGWAVACAASPWRLAAPRDADLIGELARGAANAVAETGRLAASDLDSWRAARIAAQACEIGHVDLYARPPRA